MAFPSTKSGFFMCKTFPGTQIDFTPNTGYINALSGPQAVFAPILLGRNQGYNVPWVCNSTTWSGVTSGQIIPPIPNSTNGSVEWLKTQLTAPAYATDPGGMTCLIDVIWMGSENGVCAPTAPSSGVPSSGGTNSFDAWRFNIRFTDNDSQSSPQQHLLRISTLIPNAPVLSIPMVINW